MVSALADFGPVVAVMTRSAVESWSGKPVRPDLAYLQIDNRHNLCIVTWAEVMEARRKRQRETLERRRWVRQFHAYKLWVAYFDQSLMGGWHAFVESYSRFDWCDRRTWIDRDCRHLRAPLMALFPCCLPLGTESEQWERWKSAFARSFEKRRHCRKPLGVAYIWWDRGDVPQEASWPAGNRQEVRVA